MNLAVAYDGGPNDGDLSVTNNQLDTVTGQEEIRQFSIQTLKTFLGEWVLDTTIGVPYFDMFEKGVNPDTIEALFINEILETLGVVRLLDFNLDLDVATRELQLDYEAETLDSLEPLVVSVSLP